MSIKEATIQKFNSRNAHIAVVGLGYVGLPLCVAFAKAGYSVTGIDVDGRKVEAINSGESYIEDIPSEVLQSLLPARLEMAVEMAGVSESVMYSSSSTVDLEQSIPTRVYAAHQ